MYVWLKKLIQYNNTNGDKRMIYKYYNVRVEKLNQN